MATVTGPIIQFLEKNNIWGESTGQPESGIYKRAQSLANSGITTPEQLSRYLSVVKADPNSLANVGQQAYIKNGYEGFATTALTNAGFTNITPEMIAETIARAKNNGVTQTYNLAIDSPMSVGQNSRDAYEKQQAAKQAARLKELTTSTQGEYGTLSDPNTIIGGQYAQLKTGLNEQKDVAQQRLQRYLSAMGLGQSGSQVAGNVDIEDKYAKALSTGAQGLLTGGAAAARQSAENVLAGSNALTRDELANYWANARQKATNEFELAKEQRTAVQSPAWWQYLLKGAGTAAGTAIGGPIGAGIMATV